jgi:hypothetical protein
MRRPTEEKAMYDQAMLDWEPLQGLPAPALLEDTRQAHWALQSVAAVGAGLVAPRPDDSHASTSWLTLRRALAGEATPGGHRAALELDGLNALLLDGDGGMVERQALAGCTLPDALSWFAGVLAKHDGTEGLDLSLPSHDLPPHGVGSGAAFEPGPGMRELARWYANAARFLEEVRAASSGASNVRCWPHHFDIATLITLDTSLDPEQARSIGVGLSPGDGSIEEPYFYVNPWPRPEAAALPPLEGPGSWHTENWVGAVLKASVLLTASAGDQAHLVAAHLEAALAACRTALG